MENKSEYVGVSDDRRNHMLQVAKKMKLLATEKKWEQAKIRDMFVLGLVHDCGYEFSVTQPEHEHVGGDMLRRVGFQYWQEVYYHGDPNAPYESEELTLLNIADFTTSAQGREVTPAYRLHDIGERYGTDSIQYIKAEKLAKKLGLL